MKSPSYHWNQKLPIEASPILPAVQKLSQKICYGAKIVSVFILMQIGLIVVYLGIQSNIISAALQAAIFLSSFLFLAIAIDTKDTLLAGLLTITGLVLPVLAFLSSHLAVEFSLLAVAIISLWAGAAVIVRERFSPASA